VAENRQKSLDHYQMKNIVLATDFLESSRLALDYAVALCHHFDATLTIVHAFELPYVAEEAEILAHRASVSRKMAHERLEAFATGVRRLGINVNVDLREGDPCNTVLKSALDHHCDLLVLGTHGIYKGVYHAVVGSNAEKILLSTQCPTLTVGRHVMAGVDLNLGITEVLVISDWHCETLSPLLYGLWLGSEFGVPVHLMHVRTEGEAEDSVLGERLAGLSSDALKGFTVALEPEWSSAQFHLDRIFSAHDVIQRVETSLKSLIVTGVHLVSRMERHLHASLAFELAARAASPLLSLPCNETRL